MNYLFVQLSTFRQSYSCLFQFFLKQFVLVNKLLNALVLSIDDDFQLLLVFLQLMNDSFIVFLPVAESIITLFIISSSHLKLHPQSFDMLMVLFYFGVESFYLNFGIF